MWVKIDNEIVMTLVGTYWCCKPVNEIIQSYVNFFSYRPFSTRMWEIMTQILYTKIKLGVVVETPCCVTLASFPDHIMTPKHFLQFLSRLMQIHQLLNWTNHLTKDQLCRESDISFVAFFNKLLNIVQLPVYRTTMMPTWCDHEQFYLWYTSLCNRFHSPSMWLQSYLLRPVQYYSWLCLAGADTVRSILVFMLII